MKILLLCLAGWLLVFSSPLLAQASPTPLTNSQPAAGAISDPASATRAWLETVPADKRARSDAYFEGGYWLILWQFLLTAAISIVLLKSGWSARFRNFAERLTRHRWLQPAIYGVCYVSVVALLTFPYSVYADYFREHAYGLATQNFGSWMRDQAVGLAVSLVASMLGLVVLYAVFRHAARTWWLWGTGVAICFMALGSLVAPVFVAPLFNTYKPLTDAKISAPILVMAQANEIPVQQVFAFDASRQSNRVSANVSGLFGTTRISLNDNLLQQCSLPEIRAVMAHEMGHYVLNHSLKLVLYFGLFFFAGFSFVRVFFDRAVARWGGRWDVRGISDPAGLPLLALLFATVFFLLTPLSNTAVRVTEREADAFGLNTAREAAGFARVALKLSTYRKLDPTPLEEFIFFDHPSGRARIRMAMDWQAANLPVGDAGKQSGPR